MTVPSTEGVSVARGEADELSNTVPVVVWLGVSVSDWLCDTDVLGV